MNPWHTGCLVEFSSPEYLGRVSLALGVGYLLETRTPWVALSAVNGGDPTERHIKTNTTNK